MMLQKNSFKLFLRFLDEWISRIFKVQIGIILGILILAPRDANGETKVENLWPILSRDVRSRGNEERARLKIFSRGIWRSLSS